MAQAFNIRLFSVYTNKLNDSYWNTDSVQGMNVVMAIILILGKERKGKDDVYSRWVFLCTMCVV